MATWRYMYSLNIEVFLLHLRCNRNILLNVTSLSFLLMISGDVETNPGPKITDKPTVEKLVSFFQSLPNWKLIVIHLPEMVLIDYINVTESFTSVPKQQEAFFSRWLEICDSASWKDVYDVLKAIGQNVNAQRLLDFLEQKRPHAPKEQSLAIAAQPQKTQSTTASVDTNVTTSDASVTANEQSLLLLDNTSFTSHSKSPKEIFRAQSNHLSSLIKHNLFRVTDILFAKGLIPEDVKDDILTTPGISDYRKAIKVVAVLKSQLEVSSDPDQFLVNICHALDVADVTLHGIVTNMLQDLGNFVPGKAVITKYPHDINNYIDIISEEYRRQHIVESDWPPRVGKDFFGRLALVVETKLEIETNRSDDKQALSWSMLRGRIDDIVRLPIYEEILLEDILKPTDPPSPLRIVVDGPPGIGKTTLCRKLCNKWANNTLNEDYDLVLHCPLRNSKIAKATTLADLFVVKCKESPAIVKWFEDKNGEGLLIIFDGWDELSTTFRESSLIASIICRKALVKCSVIVTSRSYASYSLLKLGNLSRHVQVIGFSENEIATVVRGTLKDQQLAEKLIYDLSVRSDVQSLCYVPLVCSMVILIYSKNHGHLPKTLTELYENFILQTIRRHVEKTRISINPRQLDNLNNLPNDFSVPLRDMCKFAYTSLKRNENKMTFLSSHIPESVSKESYLGLITTIFDYDDEFSQFLHLSIQEFLAAWWIAKYDKQREKLFKENFNDDHFRMCLRFVAGLTNLKPEESYQQYFNKPLDLQCKRRPLFGFDLMHESWFHENPEIRSSSEDHYHHDKFDNLAILLIQLLYESQNINFCQLLAKSTVNCSLCFHRTTLSLFDTLCLSYYINNSNATWDHIHLGDFTQQHQIIFNNRLVTNESVLNKRLEVKLIEPTNETISNLLTLPFIHNIKECYFDIFRGQYSPCHVLLDLLRLPNLKVIHISIVSPTFLNSGDQSLLESYRQLMLCLENNTTIEEMKYEYSGEGEMTNVINTIMKGLTNNKTLKSFSLAVSKSYDKNRPPKALPIGTIEELLSKNNTLQALKLTDDLLPSEMNIKKVSTPLQALEIGRDDIMVSILPHIQGLRCLSLPWAYPMTELFDSHPNLEELTIPIDNYSSLLQLFDLLQKKEKLKAARIIIKDGADIAEGWENWSLPQSQFNPIADISNLFEGISDTLSCFELIMPYQYYLQAAALVGCLTIGFTKFPNLRQMRIALPLSKHAQQIFTTAFIMMRDLTELQINYVPEGDYNRSEIGYIQTSRFYEAGIPLVSTHLQSFLLQLKLLSINCTHLTDEMKPEWKKNVKQLLENIYRHPKLEYIKVPYCLKAIVDSIEHDKPLPLIEFQA